MPYKIQHIKLQFLFLIPYITSISSKFIFISLNSFPSALYSSTSSSSNECKTLKLIFFVSISIVTLPSSQNNDSNYWLKHFHFSLFLCLIFVPFYLLTSILNLESVVTIKLIICVSILYISFIDSLLSINIGADVL